MAIGDKITADEYNRIRNKAAKILGTGTGSFGYGQTVQSSTVTAGELITEEQFDNLRFDIFNILRHQTGIDPIITNIADGDVIAFGATEPVEQYETLVDTATLNRFNLGTGEFDTIFNQSGAAVDFDPSPWSNVITATTTVSFTSSNEARYFWNAGGKLRFSTGRSTDPGDTQQEDQWSVFLDGLDFMFFDEEGSDTRFTLGPYNLTNSFQTVFEEFNTSTYAANSFRIEAKVNTVSNANGEADEFYFQYYWSDPYTDPGPPAPGDSVGGTFNITIDEVIPQGVLQPAPAAGAFLILGPSNYATTTIVGT